MINNLDSIFDDSWPEDHRSGVVAVVGRPNVGKSTLINRILGQKIAIVSPKPQTTRKQQLGIYTEEHGQILFVDTPGLHKPQHKLGDYMVNTAAQALKDADVILWVLDASEKVQKSDQFIAQTLEQYRGNTPVVLALNKVDLVPIGSMNFNEHARLIEHTQAFPVSALAGDHVPALVAFLMEQLPLGPRYYPAEQVSEVNMRFVTAEIIREKVILNTEQEIPHAVAVEVDSFQEGEEQTVISAVVYVEKDSQKGIIIGKGGAMIKQIGTEARQDLLELLGVRVHLDLRVKVLKNWRSNEKFMARLGYRLPKADED